MTAAKDLRPGDMVVVSVPTHFNSSTGVVAVKTMSPEMMMIVFADGTTIPCHPDDLLEAVLRERPMLA